MSLLKQKDCQHLIKEFATLREPVKLLVFTQEMAHQLAFESERVRADMVEAIEFPHLSMKYQVQGVPRTVINELASRYGPAYFLFTLTYLPNSG